MKRRQKCIFAPYIWIFSHFSPKHSFTPILMASEFLMVWDMFNTKITKKIIRKNIKVGWNDDKNTKKRQKLIFFDFFISLRFWRGRCFIMVWCMLNTKITKKKISKNFKGRKNDDEKHIFTPKNYFLIFFGSFRV